MVFLRISRRKMELSFNEITYSAIILVFLLSEKTSKRPQFGAF